VSIENYASVAEIRGAASVLLERLAFMRQAGITFDGVRDTYDIFGYDRIITHKQYRDRYHRGGIAKRIVEALPKATWRGELELIEDEDPKVSTAFEQAWDEMSTRLKVQSVLQRADILAGLSTFSVILIGAPGNFSDEMPKGKPDQVMYLTPFSGGGGPGPNASQGSMAGASNYVDATIQSFETDVASPRYSFPATYQLRRLDAYSPELQKPVHWSRVIHIAEGILDNEVYGQPTLESVWNLLDDLDKVTGGGAEAFFQRANQGMNLNLDKDVELDPDAQAKLKDEVDEYKHKVSRILKTRGVDVKMLGSDVANFSNPADAILTQIAGAKSIPKRILTGSEMGELASSQDRDNWKDQINGRQTGYAGPNIVRQLVDRLVAYGYLPSPKKDPLAYDVRWPHIQTLTEQEKAEGAQKWASVNSTMGMTVFTEEEIRDKWYGMQPAEESDTEIYKANIAEKMALVNKTMGLTIFTPAEMRKTSYGWEPLAPELEVPIGAPERISVGAPPTEPGAEALVAAPEAIAMPKAAESSDDEMVRVLEMAIVANNTDVIDRILGVQRAVTVEPVLRSAVDVVPPDVTVNMPAPKRVKKIISYGDVGGQMRPTSVVEEDIAE
jgi:hypothetical protein